MKFRSSKWVALCVVPILLLSACASSAPKLETSVNSLSPTEPNPSSTPTKSAANEQPENNVEFTVVTSGDILLHERLWNTAKRDGSELKWDFYPQLAGISSITETADLALCHLETPLATKNENYSGYPVFNSPPEIADAIKKLGFDLCSTASNHSLDKGFAGIERTLNKLDEVGINHVGTARSAEEANQPKIVEVKVANVIYKVGIVSYTYGFNGFTRPVDKLWSANLIDADQIISDASKVRTAGAQFVIAKLHWGSEYSQKANSEQIKLANKLAESGVVDLIDGAHSHSVQPITKINNMWVAYSHGNLIATHREPETIKSEGLIVRWTIGMDTNGKLAVKKVEQIPTLITDELPVRVINVPKALSENDYSLATEARLRLAFDRSTKAVNSLGTEIIVGQ